ALPRVVVEEPGIHEDRVRAAEDQPHVVVERDRRVRRLAVEELAGRRVSLTVLERVDLVHGSPRWPRSVLQRSRSCPPVLSLFLGGAAALPVTRWLIAVAGALHGYANIMATIDAGSAADGSPGRYAWAC